jgi:hypothetical protein
MRPVKAIILTTARVGDVAVIVAVVLLVCARSFAQAPAQRQRPPLVPTHPIAQAPLASGSWETWRASMSQVPLPSSGCFEASYPMTTWQEVPCTTPPPDPLGPANGFLPETVGSGTDYTAETVGLISRATGSFASVTGLTNESDSATMVADDFTLQLNSNPFASPAACQGATNPAVCQGWQQFAFVNLASANQAYAFMQYWLLNYGTCPAGWTNSPAGSSNCYFNSKFSHPIAPQTIANLAHLSLLGIAASQGTDTVMASTTGGNLYAYGQDSVLNLSQGWQAAEFNVFGLGSYSQAQFNSGATVVVVTSVDDGTTNAPACLSEGFTGETNNLTLVNPCCAMTGSPPRIVFTESSAAGVTSVCACPPGTTWNPSSETCVCDGLGQVLEAGQCVCTVPNETIVNGQCELQKNACGGSGPLPHPIGASCGASGGHWTCNGQGGVNCQKFPNACGGSSPLPQIPGAGDQPGEKCTCGPGAQGHFYCNGANVLACDCRQ